jgi:MFS family permease
MSRLGQLTRERRAGVGADAGAGAGWRVPANVWGLGVTSLLTDISSEMIVSVLPAYLVLTAGFAPLLLGVATSLHEGGPLLVTWIGGWAADRSGRRKLTAACGYALSAVCRLGWLLLPARILPGRAVSELALLIVSDRMGKAIRTAPRDALISLSVRPAQLATAFGVHRALDAAGAAAGPVLAFTLLWHFPRRFDIVFFASFIAALLGVAALLLLVREQHPVDADQRDQSGERDARGSSRGTTHVWSEAWRVFADPALRRVIILAAGFGLVTINDAFVYVLLMQRSPAHTHWIPLLYAGTAAAFLLLAVPIGALADRAGRQRVFVLGHVPLLLAYAIVLGGAPAWPANAILCVLLLGGYYASTDGVLASLAGGLLPAPVRAMGLAWVDTAVSVGRLCSSMLFGLLWTHVSARTAVLTFAAALFLIMASFAFRPEDGTTCTTGTTGAPA